MILGGNVRVGLEDNLMIERGKLAASNADQVRKIRTWSWSSGTRLPRRMRLRQIFQLKGKVSIAS